MKKNLPCVCLLFAVFLLIGSDTFIISPLIPAISREMRVSAGNGGLLVSAYSVFYVVFTFLLGPLSDRIGRKRMMIAGLLLFAAASFLTGIVGSFVPILLARGATGIGAAFIAPNVWAYIGDRFTGRGRGKATAAVASALSFGLVIGVPLGTWLGQRAGWQFCFTLLGIYALALTALLLLFLPENVKRTGQDKARHTFRKVFSDPRAVWSFLVSFSVNFATFGCYTFLGYWLIHVLRQPAAVSGTVFLLAGIGNLGGVFLSGALSGKNGPGKLVGVFLLALTAAFCILPFVGGILVLATVGIVAMMAAGGAAFSSMQTFVTQLSDHARGTVVAVNNGFMWSGTAMGAAVLGIFINRWGFAAAMLLCAGCCGVACVIFRFVIKP
ncbi:MAG: MFS transporter [Ethanoligenens sp.]